MKIIFKPALLFFLLFSVEMVFAQEYSIGTAALFNFSTGGFGIGIRTEHPLKRVDLLEGVVISPQINLYPAVGSDISEIYLGASGHLKVYRYQKWEFYTLVNLAYRQDINDDENENSNRSSLASEAGIGVTRRACFRPFAELRLNVVEVEPNIRIGILYTINCDIKGAVPCSKIPPQPQF